jgi:hypothetical protein
MDINRWLCHNCAAMVVGIWLVVASLASSRRRQLTTHHEVCAVDEEEVED